MQAALHAFIASGSQEEHLARVRAAYLSRSRARWTKRSGSTSPTGRVSRVRRADCSAGSRSPRAVDGDELFIAARERGVLVGRGSALPRRGGGRNTLRLTFASAAEEQIRSGIAVLGELLSQRWPKDRAASRERDFEAVPIL